MIDRSDIETWLWILKYWIVLFPILLIIGIFLGQLVGPSSYWTPFLVGVPVTVIPITYRNLVGGGCNLRFQMCSLVKGMTAGVVFLFLSVAADYYLWGLIGPFLGWSPLSWTPSMAVIHQLWFFSATVGGFGARIMEIRGHSRAVTGETAFSVIE
ncbi:MAG: hypothetical protein ACE5H4_06110 [Candidatus Thorarchaeota archaeon]